MKKRNVIIDIWHWFHQGIEDQLEQIAMPIVVTELHFTQIQRGAILLVKWPDTWRFLTGR